ncbi:protein fantom isoform X1 [Hydra vulgaris]|uniref:protein fantom isoform X1 n=1 Tax=Hydra vulgaris TaxID=6087 RepID=UPI001F5ECAB8|nr:protein fantom [Hydra vulgaris]
MGSKDPFSEERPVKETHVDIPNTISEAKEKQIVSSLNREELEDRYLRMRDEHTNLKKTSHKQEEKMKQMATKLLKISKDRRKIQEGGPANIIELQEKIEELQSKVFTLENANVLLKNKLEVNRQQLETHGKKATPYDHIQSRINTGPASKRPNTAALREKRIKDQIRVHGSPPPPKDMLHGSPRSHSSPHSYIPPPILPQPRYGHSLLEESRLENQDLNNIVTNLQNQLQEYEDKVIFLEEMLYKKELKHEEEIQKLRSSENKNQKTVIKENVELIKLQREVKEKIATLQNLQSKYGNLEEMMNKVKVSHDQVLEEMESLTSKLKNEQLKNTMLQNELNQGNISKKTLDQKEEQINDLKAEVQLLKEAHEKLLHSTFDLEKDREFRSKEKQYQIKIAQLEATIKCDVSEKNEIIDKLTSERDISELSKRQLRDLQVKYFELQENYNNLMEKMKFFSNESSVDFNEIQEALFLIKTRKEKESQDLLFLDKAENQIDKDLRKEIQQLNVSHAETIRELEKTRSMLVLQHNINKDYQKEVEITTKKMEELKRECDIRVKEYAELLDIRAARIKKLESQLKDIAYGTKQYKIKKDDTLLDEDDDDGDAEFQLERGENIFEIHFGKAYITKDGLKEFNGSEPSTFLSYEFFEHELQTTPLAFGINVDFNHTSTYKVKVDDFFLHYLQKEPMLVEFHQAFGIEYRTIAKSSIQFKELLDRSYGRLHGTISCRDVERNKEIAIVEFWIRLRVPMEQALRLYKERTKALGYITSKELDQLENPTNQSLRDSSINELLITIKQCQQLIPKNKDVQPSSYCVYKFFDFADHDTDIVSHSNSPQFHDSRIFPVPMTEELDNYLKNSSLEVYVFDDLDTDLTSYIGLASIPLITLTQDKPLKGKFELTSGVDGSLTGIIEVSLSWQYTYLPASAKKARTYPQPIDTRTDRIMDLSSQSQVHKSVMVPMVTSGKLFEPQVSKPDNDMDSEVKPTSDHKPLSAKFNKEPPSKERHVSIKKFSVADIKDDETQFTANSDDTTLNKSQLKTMNIDELSSKSVVQLNKSDKISNKIEDEHTANAETLNMADTMFEESGSDSDVVMVSARLVKSIIENQISDETEDTEDDAVVASSLINDRKKSLTPVSPTIVVEILSLTLFEDAALLNMENIQQLFISYKFLDYDPEELETPMSLPKPKANRPISFNFRKVFRFDENSKSVQHLIHLLMPEHPNEGRLFFTVVSDPAGDSDGDCEDVGIAYVDLVEILRNGKDIIEEDINIYDLIGDKSAIIGSLTVTVEALNMLKSLYED